MLPRVRHRHSTLTHNMIRYEGAGHQPTTVCEWTGRRDYFTNRHTKHIHVRLLGSHGVLREQLYSSHSFLKRHFFVLRFDRTFRRVSESPPELAEWPWGFAFEWVSTENESSPKDPGRIREVGSGPLKLSDLCLRVLSVKTFLPAPNSAMMLLYLFKQPFHSLGLGTLPSPPPLILNRRC